MSLESAEQPQRESLAISLGDLLTLSKLYDGDQYKAACALIRMAREKGLDGSISPGGLLISFLPEEKEVAAEVLAAAGIDSGRLTQSTFHEDLILNNGLQRLAAKDPLGFGAKVLGKITEGQN